MSVESVRQAIREATSNDQPTCQAGAHISAVEAQRIVRAAETTPTGKQSAVTPDEGKQIADLFARRVGTEVSGPGQMHTMGCPENAAAVTMDPQAVATIRDFLLRRGVDAASLVERGTVDKLIAAYRSAESRGPVEWRAQAGGMPVGVRMLRVELFADRHPDGYAYTALVPVGVLKPGAQMTDPNKAQQFYVQRTGGIAGWTQVAGPFSLEIAGS